MACEGDKQMNKRRRGSALYFKAQTRNFAQGSDLQHAGGVAALNPNQVVALNNQAIFDVSTGIYEYHQTPVVDPTGVWLASYRVIDSGFTHLSIPSVVAELVS
jgi:hypothetical protein